MWTARKSQCFNKMALYLVFTHPDLRLYIKLTHDVPYTFLKFRVIILILQSSHLTSPDICPLLALLDFKPERRKVCGGSDSSWPWITHNQQELGGGPCPGAAVGRNEGRAVGRVKMR